MGSKPSKAVKPSSREDKSGLAPGRAGTAVLTGMATGLLILAGCRTAGDAERVHIRQEMDYATVDITDSDSPTGRVRWRSEGIGYVGTRGDCCNCLPTEEELRPTYGF